MLLELKDIFVYSNLLNIFAPFNRFSKLAYFINIIDPLIIWYFSVVVQREEYGVAFDNQSLNYIRQLSLVRLNLFWRTFIILLIKFLDQWRNISLELKSFFDAGNIMVGKLFIVIHAFRNAILHSINLLLHLSLKFLTDRL